MHLTLFIVIAIAIIVVIFIVIRINSKKLFPYLAGVVSGTNITLPGSGMLVVGGGTGLSTTTLSQAGASQTVVEVHAGEAPSMQWQVQGTSDVGEFLRKMNAERMHLEQQIGREEETAVYKLLKEQVRLKKKRNREVNYEIYSNML